MLLALTLATLTLAPAPGAPPTAVFRGIALDARGRGQIPSGIELSAPGLRFVKSPEGIMYFPADYRLLAWTLAGPEQPASAQILVKDPEGGSWENARAFEAPVEIARKKAHVRFAVPPGRWDLAVVVPGFAPAFGKSSKLAPATLQRAARLKARVLDTRSGRPPDRWEAFVARVASDPESEEAKFFEKRPISAGRAALDFASLPVGGWELRIDVPGKGRRSQLVSAFKPGQTTDLGDVYISDSGGVRVVLEFPVEVPEGDFTVTLARRPADPQQMEDVDLVTKTVTPKAETTVEFADVEPGRVIIKVADVGELMPRRDSPIVRDNEVSEVRFVFVPVRLHGRVLRRDEAVAAASVSTPQHGKKPVSRKATTDDFGSYSLRTWSDGKTVWILTVPPDAKLPYIQEVRLASGETEVEHDVQLPSNQIRVVVHDAETGRPVPDAEVLIHGTNSAGGGFGASEQSDTTGHAEIRNLEASPVDIRVTKDGYSTAEIRGVEPRSDDSELDIRLSKSGLKLVVRVTDEGGTPIPTATVGLDPDSQGYNFTRTASPSSEGRYEFRDIGPGSHVLGVLTCERTIVMRTIRIPPDKDGEHVENVQLYSDVPPLVVHVEDAAGTPTPGTTFRWVLNGLPLPLEDWGRVAQTCGQPVRSDSEGNLRLHGFPHGALAALPLLGPLTPVGTFTYDGTESVWTIRLAKDPNANARRQAAR